MTTLPTLILKKSGAQAPQLVEDLFLRREAAFVVFAEE